MKGIVVPRRRSPSRRVLDELQEFVKRYGATALAWIKLGDETTSSLLKAIGRDGVSAGGSRAGREKGDAVLIVAGKREDGRGQPGSVAKRSRAARETDSRGCLCAVVGHRVSDV